MVGLRGTVSILLLILVCASALADGTLVLQNGEGFTPNQDGEGTPIELVRQDGLFYTEPFGVTCPESSPSCAAEHWIPIPDNNAYEKLIVSFDFTTDDLLREGWYQVLAGLRNACSGQYYWRFQIRHPNGGEGLTTLDARGYANNARKTGDLPYQEHTQYRAEIVYDFADEEAYVTVYDSGGALLHTVGDRINSDPANRGTVSSTQDGLNLVFGSFRSFPNRIHGQPHLWEFSNLVVEAVPYGETADPAGPEGADLSSDDGRLAFLAATMISLADGDYTLDCGPGQEVLTTPPAEAGSYCVLSSGGTTAFGTFADAEQTVLASYNDAFYAAHVAGVDEHACDSLDITRNEFQECPGAIRNMHTYAQVQGGASFVIVSRDAIDAFDTSILEAIVDFFRNIFGIGSSESASSASSLPLRRFHHGYFSQLHDRLIAATWLNADAAIVYQGFVTSFSENRPEGSEFLSGSGRQVLRLSLAPESTRDISVWRTLTAALRLGDVPGAPVETGYCGDGEIGFQEQCEPSVPAGSCADLFPDLTPANTTGDELPPTGGEPLVFRPLSAPFVPSVSEPVRRVSFDLDRGLTFSKIVVDLDVTPGPLFPGNPDGTHSLFWLHRGSRGEEWKGNILGYVNMVQRGKARVSHSVDTDQISAQTGQTVGYAQGQKIRFRYTYDTAARTVTVTANGNPVFTGAGTAQTVRSESYETQTPGFFIWFGNEDHSNTPGCEQGQCGPEVPTYGWTYENAEITFYPSGTGPVVAPPRGAPSNADVGCFPADHERACQLDIGPCLGSRGDRCFDDWTEPPSGNPCQEPGADPVCPTGGNGPGGGGPGGSSGGGSGGSGGGPGIRAAFVESVAAPWKGHGSDACPVGYEEVIYVEISEIRHCKLVNDLFYEPGVQSFTYISDYAADRGTSCPSAYEFIASETIPGILNRQDYVFCKQRSSLSYTLGNTQQRVLVDLVSQQGEGQCSPGYEKYSYDGKLDLRFCAKYETISYKPGSLCSGAQSSCSTGADCCNGLACVSGTCQESNLECSLPGQSCSATEECCGADTGSVFCSGTCRVLTGNCFVAGTPILTPGGSVPIEELVDGAIVSTHDVETGVTLPSEATIIKRTVSELVRIVPAGLPQITTTPDHPFYTERGWIAAGDLTPEDRLLTPDSAWIEIASLSAESVPPTPVYNLHVRNAAHTFYAGGVLVHNKAPVDEI